MYKSFPTDPVSVVKCLMATQSSEWTSSSNKALIHRHRVGGGIFGLGSGRPGYRLASELRTNFSEFTLKIVINDSGQAEPFGMRGDVFALRDVELSQDGFQFGNRMRCDADPPNPKADQQREKIGRAHV